MNQVKKWGPQWQLWQKQPIELLRNTLLVDSDTAKTHLESDRLQLLFSIVPDVVQVFIENKF